MLKEGIIREQITVLDNGKISHLQVFEIAAEAVTSSQTYVMILRWDVEKKTKRNFWSQSTSTWYLSPG